MRVYVEDGNLAPFSAVIETPRSPNTVAIRNIGSVVFPLSAYVFTDDVDAPSKECVYSSMIVQGGALRTYPLDPWVESAQVFLETDGRPLNARIELLQGPNNNKQVIELYTEDGRDRPFLCVLETPGAGGVVRVINTAPVEFPMTAAVVPHTIQPEVAANAAGVGAWVDECEPYPPGKRGPVAATASSAAGEAQAAAAFAKEQAEAAKATAAAAEKAARVAQQEANAAVEAARAEEAAAAVREQAARKRRQAEEVAARVRQEEARKRQQAAAAARKAAQEAEKAAAAEKPWWDQLY